MAEKFKEYFTKAAALEHSAAVDKALGHPMRGVHVGLGPHASMPEVYTPGAVGWTETECAVEVDEISGSALLTLTERAAALSVRDVVVNGRPVRLDFRGALSTKPAKFSGV